MKSAHHTLMIQLKKVVQKNTRELEVLRGSFGKVIRVGRLIDKKMASSMGFEPMFTA
jgi:hypothetical protein